MFDFTIYAAPESTEALSKVTLAVIGPVISGLFILLGAILSARYFVVFTESRKAQQAQKLTRYTEAFASLAVLAEYWDDLFDYESRDFKTMSSDRVKAMSQAQSRLLTMMNEANFVISLSSVNVLKRFFRSADLLHEYHDRVSPDDERQALERSQHAVKTAHQTPGA